MKEKIKTVHIKEYEFNEKERQEILKRVLEENKFNLCTYWDYQDELEEEQIYKIITEEDGLSAVEIELYDLNIDYIEKQISEMLEESLNEKEKTCEDLKDFLRDELISRWDFNILDLLKNSSARFRIELNTNEDFGFLPDMEEGKGEYYNLIRKRFKEVISEDDLKNEINEFMGSDYGKLTFFFKVSGENILKLREEYQKGQITINKGLGCGLFNAWSGCGSMLEIHLEKDIKLNVKNWTDKEKYNNGYYSLDLSLDSFNYGINQTYGLIGECWKEF